MPGWKRSHRRAGASLLALPALALASPAAAQTPPAEVLKDGEYAQLEITVTLDDPSVAHDFETACPSQSLWSIDFKTLLGGGSAITVGMKAHGPGMPDFSVTPLAITKSGGWFTKKCTATINQIRYLSPVVSVSSHAADSFSVSASYERSKTVSPDLITAATAAIDLAQKIAVVPAETASVATASMSKVLNGISASQIVTITDPLPIGPDLAAATKKWVTPGFFVDPATKKPFGVTLQARIKPVATLIRTPAAAGPGNVTWAPSNVLSATFLGDIGSGAPGTFGSYADAKFGTDLGRLGDADTVQSANYACSAVKSAIDKLGLSRRDAALFMWAMTRNHAPAKLAAHELDGLKCLEDTWQFAPAELITTRKLPPPPPVVTLLAPDTDHMANTAERRDAFAVFFKAAEWTTRKAVAEQLFAYPLAYDDADALLFKADASIPARDSWLQYDVTSAPVAARVGCYAYQPGKDGAASTMYAIAENILGQQALITATFANSDPTKNPLIAALKVSKTIAPAVRTYMVQANAGGCSSAWRPALLFGQ